MHVTPTTFKECSYFGNVFSNNKSNLGIEKNFTKKFFSCTILA